LILLYHKRKTPPKRSFFVKKILRQAQDDPALAGSFFENEEFVADEVPNERESGSQQFGDLGPEDGAQTEERRNVGSDACKYQSVDNDADDADGQELREFDGFLLRFRLVLECPVFVHEIAVDDSYRKRNAVQDKELNAGCDAGDVDEDIQNEKINAGVDASNDDEFGKLLGKFQENILIGRRCHEGKILCHCIVHKKLLIFLYITAESFA